MEIKPIYERLLIFDGSHCLHRNLSIPNNWDMQTSTGIRTGGVFGVLRSILKELKTYNYFPVVVFDGSLSKRRLEIYPNYKRTLDKQMLMESTEPKTEEQLFQEEYLREYHTQRGMLEELLPAFGIPVIHLQDWEGDDIIYILTKLSKNSIVVSDDKDLLQLIKQDENNKCRVRRAMRDEFWDINTLNEKEMTIKDFISCKAIVGDNSDNIPSACFQVGDKTAPGLYKLYETVCLKNGQPFPTTEEELDKVCKDNNLPKRKAYLNFNETQFLTNMALTDLSLVDKEITEELIKYICDNINIEEGNINDNVINIKLNSLEIRTFDINSLLRRVKEVEQLLNSNTGMAEINQVATGTLF